MDKNIDINTVLSMQSPTKDFLVELKDNIYGIRFKGFQLRETQTGEIYHSFQAENIFELDYFADNELNYLFPNKILKSQNLGSNLTLVVGNNLVKNLTLIERHYIDDKLTANYKFDFPLFMPNSENNVEFMYQLPQLSAETIEKINNGADVFAKSDTFIFVEGKLTIHRRANYVYSAYH